MSAISLDQHTIIQLRLDMLAYEEIIKEYGGFNDMIKLLADQEKSLETYFKLAAIFANSAAYYVDDSKTYTVKQIKSLMRPSKIHDLCQAVNEEIRAGMTMDTENAASDEPNDVILEEIEKKSREG